MTDHEKELERNFPELEILKRRIDELNSMDLSTISVSALSDKINDYLLSLIQHDLALSS